ncbi:MAG TPA: DUF5682 family protein [Saprospiraceae bacterium]|nr:DUF5682 family protein [Saprospiraceae bacterium]
MERLKIFGIRHHGAGSALRLQAALEIYQPDCLCIELPHGSSVLIPNLTHEELLPPLAFLFYSKKNPKLSSFLPMASFSPEYVALQYALKKKIPILCIDQPAEDFVRSPRNSEDLSFKNLSTEQRNMVNDPLGYLAKLGGYVDTERWWEIYFEQWTDHVQLFEVIQQLIHEMRLQTGGLDDPENLRREKFMREQIRQVLKESYKKIAVVVGAWHGPVLTEEMCKQTSNEKINYKPSDDIQFSLIAWTYHKLASSKWYTAGVTSPLWHEALFENSEHASGLFLSRLVEILRSKNNVISTADLISAEQLAAQLASLRQMIRPGLDELLEAAICVFGEGNSTKIDQIKQLALVGNKTGFIPPHLQNLPLLKEFKQSLKELKLDSYWSQGFKEEMDLDLRKEKHLKISQFLYCSILMNLQWTRIRESEIKARGNFHEYWKFNWYPELELEIIEFSFYGNSIKEAIIEHYLKFYDASVLPIATVLEYAFKANIHELTPILIDRIRIQSIEETDVYELAQFLRPLLSVIDYGALQSFDVIQLKELVEDIIPRIMLALPESVKTPIHDRAIQLNKSISLLDQCIMSKSIESDEALWKQQKLVCVHDSSTHPTVRAYLWRMILEQHPENSAEIDQELSSLFLRYQDSSKTVLWLEGFLMQTTVFFSLHQKVLDAMNYWLGNLDKEEFKEILVFLRRVFTTLPLHERKRILKLVQKQAQIQENEQNIKRILDPILFHRVKDQLQKINLYQANS